MHLLVVGGGGREHALIRKLRENPEVEKIYALPGNAGIAQLATCVPIGAKEIDRIVEFAIDHAVGYAVVAQDDPLVLGAVDALNRAGIPCFGPDAKAARIEGSKVFAKALMEKYSIPTARYRVFSDLDAANAYLDECAYPAVIKADGLALGKGVVIAENIKTAKEAARGMLSGELFGKSGARVVIEEYLEGPEVSVLAFTDGHSVVPMPSSMDHKRAEDGDRGLNTGGMGAIAPNPYYTPDIAKTCMETIFLPTVRAMAQEGAPFKGCLYFGLMLTKAGPKVIEYNCRFGDPETQVILPLLESDLLQVMRATTDGTLDKIQVRFAQRAACCVVLASGGYPVRYTKGYPITFGHTGNALIYHAGTKMEDGRYITNGGRVLGVTCVCDTLPEAIDAAYISAGAITFHDRHMRTDIGRSALEKR